MRESGREIRDGEIVTACEQGLPVGSNCLRNANDPNSRVSKLRAQQRNYNMLGELNARPRTTYLGAVRNLNPEPGESMSEGPVNSPKFAACRAFWSRAYSYASVTDQIASIVLTRPVSMGWLAGSPFRFTILMVLLGSIAWLIIKGVGIWASTSPIGWGFAIVNFVWWIGIATPVRLSRRFFSLLNQQWAHFHQPLRRSHDAFSLSLVAAVFPGHSRGPSRGWRSTCSRIRARWVCGRNFAAH